MKTWIIFPLFLFSTSAFAESFGEIAFERLASDLGSAQDFASRAESAAAYFDVLERVGEAPVSASLCLKSILKSDRLGSCLPTTVSARSGGGTGGVD